MPDEQNAMPGGPHSAALDRSVSYLLQLERSASELSTASTKRGSPRYTAEELAQMSSSKRYLDSDETAPRYRTDSDTDEGPCGAGYC